MMDTLGFFSVFFGVIYAQVYSSNQQGKGNLWLGFIPLYSVNLYLRKSNSGFRLRFRDVL